MSYEGVGIISFVTFFGVIKKLFDILYVPKIKKIKICYLYPQLHIKTMKFVFPRIE